MLEEDATYAESLVRGLSAAGCEVTLARDGDAGLLRAQKESFDVLLVSAELPGINGFRLCGRLRKQANFSAPIVLMGSERTVGFEEHQKLPSRANGYVRKPVVIAELLAMLEQLPHDGRVAAKPKTLPPGRPKTLPPPMPRPTKAGVQKPTRLPNTSTLQKALEEAEGQATAVSELRKQLALQEQLVARLQKEKSSKAPPPVPTRKVGGEAIGRQQAQKRDEDLAEARTALDAERHAALDLRNASAEREARLRALEFELREQTARATRAEELASIGAGAREEANRRHLEHGKQLESVRSDLTRARAEIAKLATERQQEETTLKADIDRERARAEQAEANALRADAATELLKTTHAAEVDRARALAEQYERRVMEVAAAANASNAALETERARRSAAEQAARKAQDEADADRRSRVAIEADLARKLDAATRLAQDTQKSRAELESAHAKRLTGLRAHHEAERTKLLEDARAARASEKELQQEVGRREDKGAEDLTRAEERYVRHMSDVNARERMQATALADAERASEEIKALRGNLETSQARILELETSLENMFEAQTASRHSGDAVAAARAQMDSEWTVLDAARRQLETALETHRKDLEQARLERDQAIANETATASAMATTETAAKEKVERADNSLRQLRAAHAAEINLLREAHGRALGAKDRALAEALSRVAREVQERVTKELTAEHATHTAEAVQRARDEAEVEYAAQLADVHANRDDAVSTARGAETERIDGLTTQIAELSRALASNRESLDAERRDRLKEEAGTANELEALEIELNSARNELASKSTEIESLRRTLEHESIVTRAAVEELERERTLIAQAKTVLSELVSRIDDPSTRDEEPPSKRARRR